MDVRYELFVCGNCGAMGFGQDFCASHTRECPGRRGQNPQFTRENPSVSTANLVGAIVAALMTHSNGRNRPNKPRSFHDRN